MSYGNGGSLAVGVAAYGSSVATPAPPPTESPSVIRDGIGAAEERLVWLHSTIDEVVRRLDTALTPVPPSTLGKEAQPKESVNSHVMGRLVELNRGLDAAASRLRELLGRIEL